jgi:hypothetical protein
MIIQMDSREKIGYWSFARFNEVDGEFIELIDCGDYILYDYPLKISIERKRTVEELANNLGKEYDRFCREFERMQKYEHKYCICEFTLDDMLGFPENSKLPYRQKSLIKMNGKFMLKRVNELEAKFGVKFIFVKDKTEAEETALELFKNAIK